MKIESRSKGRRRKANTRKMSMEKKEVRIAEKWWVGGGGEFK